MNSLTSERHPLLHSLSDVDRSHAPLARGSTVLESMYLWDGALTSSDLRICGCEGKKTQAYLTYPFIQLLVYFLHCTAWLRKYVRNQTLRNQLRHSLLIFGTTQAFCLEKPHAILSPGIFPHAALWCAPVGLALWRCEILLWPKYWNFAPRWWRRSPLSWSKGSEEPGWLSLWNKSRIHFGLIYTSWSVRGFQRVNLKKIKLALVPKQQM